MSAPIVLHAVTARDEVLARIFVNDLPLLKGLWRGPNSQSGGLSHLLVPGQNQVAFEIHRAPPARFDLPLPPDDPAKEDEDERIIFVVYTVDDPEKKPVEPTILFKATFPRLWEGVPEERRRLPYYHVEHFELPFDVYRRAYLSAPLAEFGCRGTPQMHEAITEVHEALASGDEARYLDLVSLQMQEYAACFAADGSSSVAARSEAMREFFRLQPQVEPLESAMLHFTPRAGGRVAQVSRVDGTPVLVAVCQKDPMLRLVGDVLLTQQEGRWRIM